MSSTGAEWVRAPTEITSTPVSAIARTVVKSTPPDASSRIAPPGPGHRPPQVRQAEVVQHDHVRRQIVIDQGQDFAQLIQPIHLDL
ncbi:hypothetical protein SMCF_2842, partial [Streptomyces coelicoflavus ZG0656]